jgi:hypothetical protein
VVVVGTRARIEIAIRERLEIADGSSAGAKQPYHAAEELALPEARSYIKRCEAHARKRALASLRRTCDAVTQRGHDIVGCGMLLSSGRALPAIEGILASHALIHTADGEHVRDAIRNACEELHIPVSAIAEKTLVPSAAGALRLSDDELQQRLAELGKALGPPWTQDQKSATLAGWLALP